MPLIPIGTSIRTRRPPVGNYVLIAVNIAAFLFTDLLGGNLGTHVKSYYALDAARPVLHQYLTYQFLHGDIGHLLGNMLFLWIFGNAVCDRMGGVTYVIFYLAGGVFAGWAFTLGAENPMVGASGAIAAVTTAFLALFPRVYITMLVWMIFIFTIQLPATILIVFKIILWDNIIAPSFGQSAASNVAYSAHLGGYAFGFAVSMGLLLIEALPRNQFDMLALWSRWRRRTGLAGDGGGRRGRGTPTARPIKVQEVTSRPLQDIELTPIEELRERIAQNLADRDIEGAAGAYRRLIELDPTQVLARPQQLEIANAMAQGRHYGGAAHAYEQFLEAYPGAADAPQVRLFLGLIYSRYLQQYDRAATQLRRALDGLQLDAQRTLAEEELREAMARLGVPPKDAPPPSGST